ncbi:hexose carrier protein HEX6-like [Phoenix dactylifera]|uniref:Hexose carrier protein HEX6-like n=1 Tax=Phoenix dactylifera TaxID=42345 RepID=A0A8B8ZF92_PHODC|nr:hexose carrier protein HEX6-like [Phoenix dactylifera]
MENGIYMQFFQNISQYLCRDNTANDCTLSVWFSFSSLCLRPDSGCITIIIVGCSTVLIRDGPTKLIDVGIGRIVEWMGLVEVPCHGCRSYFLLHARCPHGLTKIDKNFHGTVETIRGTPDILAELNDIMAAASTLITFSQSLRKMIQRKYWPQLIMAATIPFFQQVAGFSIATIYTASLIQNIGFGENSLLMSALVIRLTGNISALALMTVVDRIGRRVKFMVGGIQMLISLVMVGKALATQLGSDDEISRSALCIHVHLGLLLFCAYLMTFGWSWGPLGWLVRHEIFPLAVK